MKDNNLVNKLVQARTMEATKNNVHGKLFCIARNYGSPIMGYYYDAPLGNNDDDWANFNTPSHDWSQIEEAEDEYIPRLGFVYDSLKVGTNLEIVVLVKETKSKMGKREFEKPTKVKCSYNGYTVYHEEDGKLLCYAPFPEWESHVNRMYAQATGTDKKRVSAEKQEEAKIRKKATQQTLTTLRRLWGI